MFWGGVAWALLGAMTWYASPTSSEVGEFPVQVKDAKNQPNEIWLRPYVSPALNVKQLDSKPLGETELRCIATKDIRKFADHQEMVEVLECGDHKFEIQGIAFNVP